MKSPLSHSRHTVVVMPRLLLWCCLIGMAIQAHASSEPQGFGARTRGGAEGREIRVTRLDDDPKRPVKGMLRWALQQKGPRIITFAVSGTISLKRRIEVKEPYLTLDGSTAPGLGICIRGGTLEFRNTQQIILRSLRIRLGDETTLAANKREGRKRPRDSDGLDCITLSDSRDILIEHCSLSWSCDEIIGITRCRNVTVQWCILSEPLGHPSLHPYGDAHAFGINASASTLSVHHCLFAHYEMRGPQFEVNDLRRKDRYDVRMEAINNVMYAFRRSGSRLVTGTESGEGYSKGKTFLYQLIGNYYVNRERKPWIETTTKNGVTPGLQIALLRNEGTPAARLDNVPKAPWITDAPLFSAPIPVEISTASAALEEVLARAGCSHARDAVDVRIIEDVRQKSRARVIRSQNDVGGWPDLTGEPVTAQRKRPHITLGKIR